MKNSKSIGYSIIGIVTLVITQAIIKKVSIDSIDTKVFIALLFIACSLVVFGTYKAKAKVKGFNIRYNIILATLFIIASITMGIAMIIFKEYPNIMEKYGVMITVISLSSYFIFIGFMIIYRIVYESKRR